MRALASLLLLLFVLTFVVAPGLHLALPGGHGEFCSSQEGFCYGQDGGCCHESSGCTSACGEGGRDQQDGEQNGEQNGGHDGGPDHCPFHCPTCRLQVASVKRPSAPPDLGPAPHEVVELLRELVPACDPQRSCDRPVCRGPPHLLA